MLHAYGVQLSEILKRLELCFYLEIGDLSNIERNA